MAPALILSLRRRFVWLVLLVGILAARGLTPDGWMPVANAAGGIEFTLCDGMAPAQLPPVWSVSDLPIAASVSVIHGCASAADGAMAPTNSIAPTPATLARPLLKRIAPLSITVPSWTSHRRYGVMSA